MKQRGHSDHWDFVRGLSMAVMTVMHTTYLVDWRPFKYQLMSFSYPVIEPIIFLSGYLICLRTQNHLSTGQETLGRTMGLYAVRRILRTWPLYVLYVLACYLIPALIHYPLEKSLLSFFTFTMNANLERSGLTHLWTLCVEEWCYFIFLPLIPFLSGRWIKGALLCLALWPLYYRTVILSGTGALEYMEYFTRIHYPTLTHWDSFWWGCLFAFYYDGKPLARHFGLAALAGAAAVFAASVWLGFHFRGQDTFALTFMQATFPVWGALGSALLVAGIPSLSSQWLRRTGLVRLGFMSYTFYLTHKSLMWVFIQWNRGAGWLPEKTWLELATCYVFVAMGGTLLFYIFEYPILKLLRRQPFGRGILAQAK